MDPITNRILVGNSKKQGVASFALPLLWLSPAFKKSHKIIITILVVILSIWLVEASVKLYNILLKEMQDLQSVLTP